MLFVSEGRTPGDSGCRWSHRRDAKYDHVETVEFFLFFFFAETQRLELLAWGIQILFGSRNYLKWSQTGVSVLHYLFSVVCDQLPSLSPRIPSGICSFIFKQRRTPFLWSPLPSACDFCVLGCHCHTFTPHTCANSASRDSAPHPPPPTSL